MPGTVVWVTGLSGAGKTTLCRAIRARVAGTPVVVLDGDALREAFGHDLGYTEADRMRQIRRVQRLARLIANQGVDVLVAALYGNPELLAWNRAHLPGYVEVYLRATVDALAQRDVKGLYGAYARGDARDIVGLDIPFAEPAAPDLVFDVTEPGDAYAMAEAVIARAGFRR